ncbi:hypothetical protein PSOLE_39490 [Pseudomonas oleovorans subsp. oleovorans]|nr:hypothetical protein PSOLE_39490 [Pseudomonas oleovorans subsp. oleovorans]
MQHKLRYRGQILSIFRRQKGLCALCGQAVSKETGWHDHHVIRRVDGGSDTLRIAHCFIPTAMRWLIVGKKIHLYGLVVYSCRIRRNTSYVAGQATWFFVSLSRMR